MRRKASKSRRAGRRVEIKKLPEAALRKTVKALELTPDILAGMAHLELSGNREVVVDGCRGVLEYNENVIRLMAGSMKVRFTGRGLELRNLKRDSAIVEGFITAIEFAE